ncbi:hypothetical protein JTE90_020301 [Oedothorax gibbosus]|uniref:G-protein coupled receptors family 1 profile domain-containing protein n=1 Tax=Oedothorax gibbosus TaxID=931172 RepID=A0AAV6VNU3_9ARAC|nr:hypothetical protein JTE90_020301 [Oedothorax gibbosus]
MTTPWHNETFDVEGYISNLLGPKTVPAQTLVPLTVIYSVIFLTGVVGNVCTCVVISRNQYMQTPTNCYLFNLAMADMLTLLLAMPTELYTLWHQYPWQLGPVLCWLRGMVPEATAYASILTIVTFSVERYVAICKPLHTTRRSTLSKAVRNIAIIWAAAALCALPYAFFTEVNHLNSPSGEPLPESRWCGFPFNKPDRHWEVLMLMSTLLFFVLPLTLIAVLYALIAHALKKSRDHIHADESKMRSRRTVIRMLAAVVIAFFVCFAPFHAQRLLFLYVSLNGEWTETTKNINYNLFTLAGCLYYVNSTVNPILYSVMSRRFRVAFREKLCSGPPSLWCICCCCFCCVKDFEKRSLQQHNTQHFCRNSASHSSVRSSYHAVNNHVINNNNPARLALAVDFDQKLSCVTLSCVEPPRSRYGNTLTVAPPPAIESSAAAAAESVSAAEEEEEELREELDRALRPELDKLEGETGDCCSNCSLLFQPRLQAPREDRTSTTELSSSEPLRTEQQDKEVRESLV